MSDWCSQMSLSPCDNGKPLISLSLCLVYHFYLSLFLRTKFLPLVACYMCGLGANKVVSSSGERVMWETTDWSYQEWNWKVWTTLEGETQVPCFLSLHNPWSTIFWNNLLVVQDQSDRLFQALEEEREKVQQKTELEVVKEKQKVRMKMWKLQTATVLLEYFHYFVTWSCCWCLVGLYRYHILQLIPISDIYCLFPIQVF